MKISRWLAGLMVFGNLAPACGQSVLASDAKNHIGQRETVCG